MEDDEDRPHGYIYKAINRINEKVYIGQTVSSRWNKNVVPIEGRWKEEVSEAIRRDRNGANLRYIESAIIKYGPENFELAEQDIAHSQEELDQKERDWVKEYQSTNPDKGYNLTEGGLGGRPTQEVIDKLSNTIQDLWQDNDYREKQLEARKDLGHNEEFIEKMTELNRDRALQSEYHQKMSESIKEVWQNSDYQEKVSSSITEKWNDPNYIEKQFMSRTEGRREISDKEEFLRDIRDMKRKDLCEKYNMDGKGINRRIKEMLGHQDINHFTSAKNYLQDKNLAEVVDDINENMQERSGVKKEIENKREFLQDIQSMLKKDINEKYGMNASTINNRIREMLGNERVTNYTEAKEYLKDKNLDEVVEKIEQDQKDFRERAMQRADIIDKERFLKDIQDVPKKQIEMKYNMDGKTINNKIQDFLKDFDVKNYTEARGLLEDREIKELIEEMNNREIETSDPSETIDNRESSESQKESSIQEDIEKPLEREGEDINALESELENQESDLSSIEENSIEKNMRREYKKKVIISRKVL
ncbi:MAG: hypothetical protein EU535_07890 [Promethearchaeota archaeon]|nr:MAG: hypothetical protein EU535_07890 [Candidatus Lokiarchaeota archaeon]